MSNIYNIYLDQNVLSDLRPRRLKEHNDPTLWNLARVLLDPSTRLIYSYVNLNEIAQIPKLDYQQEHIAILDALKASYIDSSKDTLIDVDVHKIWESRQHRDYVDEHAKSIEESFVQISKKLTGLSTEKSFDELSTDLFSELATLITDSLQELEKVVQSNEMPAEHLSECKKQIDLISPYIDSIRTMKFPQIDENCIGTTKFREFINDKNIDFYSLNPEEVVPTIDGIFKEQNPEFSLWNNMERTTKNLVSSSYTLMNWVGYYADDFDKDNKRGDRFNAANNDLQHTQAAINAHFFITNDNRLKRKAVACYKFIGVETIVCTPSEFFSNYCIVSNN